MDYQFGDFREILKRNIGRRVSLHYYADSIEQLRVATGRLKGLDESTKSLELVPDPSFTTEYPIETSYANLGDGGVVITWVEVIPDNADLSSVGEEESKYADVESVIEVKVGEDPETIKKYTDEGWEVKEFYSGKVQLVKKKEAETK